MYQEELFESIEAKQAKRESCKIKEFRIHCKFEQE